MCLCMFHVKHVLLQELLKIAYEINANLQHLKQMLTVTDEVTDLEELWAKVCFRLDIMAMCVFMTINTVAFVVYAL
jgi:hypothetical protein